MDSGALKIDAGAVGMELKMALERIHKCFRLDLVHGASKSCTLNVQRQRQLPLGMKREHLSNLGLMVGRSDQTGAKCTRKSFFDTDGSHDN